MNDRKPTMPRIEPMADDAATMPALRSSCFSASPGGLGGHGGGRHLQGEHGADAEHDGAEGHAPAAARRA